MLFSFFLNPEAVKILYIPLCTYNINDIIIWSSLEKLSYIKNLGTRVIYNQ